MKYKDTGFRALYHNFVVVRVNENIEQLMKDLPGHEKANGIMTYGYYDRQAGLTLEVLGAAILDDKGFKCAPPDMNSSLKLRAEALEDAEFYVVNDKDKVFYEKYKEKVDMLELYKASEDIEKTRGFKFLDPSRGDFFIDDVRVKLIKIGLQTEECWVRITGLAERSILGELLNEPYQDFGWHKGDEIAFFAHENEDEGIVLLSDMIPDKFFREEDLEDGKMLRNAISKFTSERNEENLIDVLQILRDSWVWVPCTAILSDRDNDKLEQMVKGCEDNLDDMIGQDFVANDNIRLVPDILKNGDDFYFPAFSDEESMGDYGKDFSKVARHILDVIPLAKNNEKKVKGIVINAFSEPFILDGRLYDLVAGLESRLIETTEE